MCKKCVCVEEGHDYHCQNGSEGESMSVRHLSVCRKRASLSRIVIIFALSLLIHYFWAGKGIGIHYNSQADHLSDHHHHQGNRKKSLFLLFRWQGRAGGRGKGRWGWG